MTEVKLNEVLNGGMTQRLLVPVCELDAIEQFVGKFIRVRIDDCVIIGELKRVSTVLIKSKDAGKDDEKEVFKEITIEVEQINVVERENTDYPGLHKIEDEVQNSLIQLPDKKSTMDNAISFNYGGDS